MQRTRDDGRKLDGICMEDGVLVAVFHDGHNEGVIGLDVSEALELAREILATFCESCHQRAAHIEQGECADCYRNRMMRDTLPRE